MLAHTQLNTFRTTLPLLARLLNMGTSALSTGAPGPALFRTIMTSSPIFSPENRKPSPTPDETQLLTDSIESNKSASDMIGGSIVLTKIFQPKSAPDGRCVAPLTASGGLELVDQVPKERAVNSKLGRLTKHTRQAALARLENSPWQGKFTQVKIGADGTCFYGKPSSSNFYQRIYPLMVTHHGVCIEPLPGKTITLLGSWDDLRANTSLKTISDEIGPRHTKYIRTISGETNPFAFSKQEHELNSASDRERFDHLDRAMERDEPIYVVTELDP